MFFSQRAQYLHVIRLNVTTRTTRNATRRNEKNMSNEKNNTNNARAKNQHFTIAQLSRDLNVDAKIARRRMRDAIRRNDERVIESRERDIACDDMRVKHEFRDTKRNRELITSIITNKS